MKDHRLPLALLAAGLLAAAGSARAARAEGYNVLRGLPSSSPDERRAASSALIESSDPGSSGLVPGLPCGSGVLFSTRRAGGAPFTFGTSGLLYRSNKLMVDRQTGTLWSSLTGERGRLAKACEVVAALAPVAQEARETPGIDSPAPLERIPGHQAFWSGWQSFFPSSELYRGDAGNGNTKAAPPGN